MSPAFASCESATSFRAPTKFAASSRKVGLAENNELEIVTSDLTLAEVLYLRRPEIPKEEQVRQIEDFFELDYIILVAVDRETVLDARRLV